MEIELALEFVRVMEEAAIESARPPRPGQVVAAGAPLLERRKPPVAGRRYSLRRPAARPRVQNHGTCARRKA
jgi:hypothetical protein